MEIVCSCILRLNPNWRSIRLPSSLPRTRFKRTPYPGCNSDSMPQLSKRRQEIVVRLLARPRGKECSHPPVLSVCNLLSVRNGLLNASGIEEKGSRPSVVSTVSSASSRRSEPDGRYTAFPKMVISLPKCVCNNSGSLASRTPRTSCRSASKSAKDRVLCRTISSLPTILTWRGAGI
jgi:hypothetical protein